jgi:hypothetical protein
MLLLCCEATQISCENCHFPNRAVNVKKTHLYRIYQRTNISVQQPFVSQYICYFFYKTFKLYDSCALFCALSYKNQGLATITINN